MTTLTERKKIESVEANEHHFDILGRQLRPGQVVAFCERNSLRIGKIERLTGKMTRIKPYKGQMWGDGYLKYGRDMVVLEGEDVLMYVLKSGL